MIYQLYQAQTDLADPIRKAASFAAGYLSGARTSLTPGLIHRFTAACDFVAWVGLTHTRPAFGITSVTVAGADLAVSEEAVDTTPFGTLLHFRKEGVSGQPKLLIVAPLSGHFATLLRETVRTALQDHDVYITDWHNARDVPLSAGAFDFDDYVEHLIRFLEVLGPQAHVLAICQPSVPVLAAVAAMAEAGNPAQPRTMTLMAGPIDTRVNPTKVNELAQSKPIEWFERKVIGTVPLRYAGARRRVYPGFVQLLSFMSMNIDRHRKSFATLYDHLAKREFDQAETIRSFYDEYLAVMDMPAEFYLKTIRLVFQEHALPLGQLTLRDRPINPAAIRRTALLTVEGERDDICAVGQTVAAHDLCTSIRPFARRHHVQTGAGHYGVFSGRRWSGEIYPLLRDFTHQHG